MQKTGFAIAEQIRVGNDQITDQQKGKEEREKNEEHSFHKQIPQPRKGPDKLHRSVENGKGQPTITEEEDQNGPRKKLGLPQDTRQAPPVLTQVNPSEQTKGGCGRFVHQTMCSGNLKFLRRWQPAPR